MRRLARVRKSIFYSGGRRVVKQGRRVYVEIGPTTVWVFKELDNRLRLSDNLIYTFNSKEHAREYLVLIR